jgi:hypothetical protein
MSIAEIQEAVGRWPAGLNLKKLNRLLEVAIQNGGVVPPLLLVGHAAEFEGPGRNRAISPFLAVGHDGSLAVLYTKGFHRTPQHWVVGPGTTTPCDDVATDDDCIVSREGGDPYRPNSGIERRVGKLKVTLLDRGAVVGRVVFPYSSDHRSQQLARDKARVLETSLRTVRGTSRAGGLPIPDGGQMVATPPTEVMRSEQLSSVPGSAQIPDTDWADPEAILAEWRNDSSELDSGNAMQMFEADVPYERHNVGEYLSRELKGALFDRTWIGDSTAEMCRRVLLSLSRIPPEFDFFPESTPRLIWLPLAIMRDRGWQLERYGGDGRVPVDLDVPPIVGAVATSCAPDGRYLDYFFGTR